MKHIAFVIGEPEYSSHLTMPGIATEMSARHGYRTSLCTTSIVPDQPRFPLSVFSGLDCLVDADLMVVFTRFRVLPDNQMRLIEAYLASGRPVVGLRTSTHAFHFPADSKWESWNDGFGRGVFGTPWLTHHGNSSRTDVSVLDSARQHPILNGIENAFQVRSWLYKVLPLSKICHELLRGIPVEPKTEPQENPVAWTTEHNGGRVFFTTLGHPEDFDVAPFRKLLINGIRWTLADLP